MKHLLRKYEAATSLPRSTHELLRNFRSYEAKRTLSSPCGKSTLHRAKPCFIFHAPKVRFIEKSTCDCKCFFLAPPAGLEPATT